VAPNTKHTYKTGLSNFETFRREYSLNVLWPPPISHITTFIAYLSLNNKAYRTINCYVSAINFHCKILYQYDFSYNFVIQKMFEGLRRNKIPKDTRLPISEDLLINIVNKLNLICYSLYETKLFSAAFSLAFHGFFRVGEIVLTKSCQAHQTISLDHLKFSNQGEVNFIIITIPFSKNDQRGLGATVRIQETKTSICPVKLLKEFLGLRPSIKGKLFCHFSGKPVTRYHFSSVLSKVINLLGVQKGRFRSHSFRIGAASHMFEKGASEEEIKRLGRWKSNAYKSYIRIV